MLWKEMEDAPYELLCLPSYAPKTLRDWCLDNSSVALYFYLTLKILGCGILSHFHAEKKSCYFQAYQESAG